MTATYNGEEYALFKETWIYYVDLSKDDIVPSMPNHPLYTFLGWLDSVHESFTDRDLKWYKPGDIVEDNTVRLQAFYIDSDFDASFVTMINGNGGKIANGSQYIFTFASTGNLATYKLPENQFVNENRTFSKYAVSTSDGYKYYDPGETISIESLVTNIYVMWDDYKIFSPTKGVNCYSSVEDNTIVVSLSPEWCEENGVKKANLSAYINGQMVQNDFENIKSGSGINLELSPENMASCEFKIFALDDSYCPLITSIDFYQSDF